MPSHSSKKQFLRAGLVTAVVGVLSGLAWGASAAPHQEIPAGSHLISRESAQELIAGFRATAVPGAVRSHSFARSAFDALLAQPGAAGIRIHYGQYANGKEALVLYATDKAGKDLTQLSVNASAACPPACPTSEPGAADLRRDETTLKNALPVSSHLVSREHAQELITRFRATAAPGAVRSQFLDRSAFDALLAQPGAVGIRLYYGKYSDGRVTFVLYAMDEDGQDLTQLAANRTMSCPPFCPD